MQPSSNKQEWMVQRSQNTKSISLIVHARIIWAEKIACETMNFIIMDLLYVHSLSTFAYLILVFTLSVSITFSLLNLKADVQVFPTLIIMKLAKLCSLVLEGTVAKIFRENIPFWEATTTDTISYIGYPIPQWQLTAVSRSHTCTALHLDHVYIRIHPTRRHHTIYAVENDWYKKSEIHPPVAIVSHNAIYCIYISNT